MHPKGAGIDVVECGCWGFDAIIAFMGMVHFAVSIACCVWLTEDEESICSRSVFNCIAWSLALSLNSPVIIFADIHTGLHRWPLMNNLIYLACYLSW